MEIDPKTLETEIKRLSTHGNRRKLNSLLNLYEEFAKLIALHLRDVTKFPSDWEALYKRKLVPLVRGLTEDLQLGPEGKSLFKLPPHYIPFDTLASAGKIIREKGWSTDVARDEIFFVHGILKNLATREDIRAYGQEPIPEVQAVIDETQELLNAIENAKHVHSENTPDIKPLFAATSWGGITIRFITDHDVIVQIQRPEFQTQSNFDAMGFRDQRTREPIFAWKFLRGLSQTHGETREFTELIPLAARKQKQVLSKKLKKVFGLTDDPFYSSREHRTYKIKINLEPQKIIAKRLGIDIELAEMAQERNNNTVYDGTPLVNSPSFE